MKAVITVTGKDSVGIIAAVSTFCAEHGANITEITQSRKFRMVERSDALEELMKLGKLICHESQTMHSSIYLYVHRVVGYSLAGGSLNERAQH